MCFHFEVQYSIGKRFSRDIDTDVEKRTRSWEHDMGGWEWEWEWFAFSRVQSADSIGHPHHTHTPRRQGLVQPGRAEWFLPTCEICSVIHFFSFLFLSFLFFSCSVMRTDKTTLSFLTLWQYSSPSLGTWAFTGGTSLPKQKCEMWK